jgi:deoxyribodipyrimidine photo-lyase
MPTLNEMGYSLDLFEVDYRSCIEFKGGEEQGIKRVMEYIWSNRSIVNYERDRNEIDGAEYSSKFAPWMA